MLTISVSSISRMSEPVFEIRNYHIKPEKFESYKKWAREIAVPHLGKHMNLVGFWVDSGDAPSPIVGEPLDKLGHANVTWVIKWGSMKEREEVMGKVLGGPEWAEVFKQLPGGLDNYARIEVRYGSAFA
jgi:hypothetical protein